jgi:hypothetical protein
MSRTFDIDGIPTALLVEGAYYYKLPWEKTGWKVRDLISFALTQYHTYDRQPLREHVIEGNGIWLEYLNAYVSTNYFDGVMAKSIKFNNLMSDYFGYKINFKQEYEHFGKKNKYKL